MEAGGHSMSKTRIRLVPYHWRDNKQVLPLLSTPEHCHKLEYGYACGREPACYVQRVHEYHYILTSVVEHPVPVTSP